MHGSSPSNTTERRRHRRRKVAAMVSAAALLPIALSACNTKTETEPSTSTTTSAAASSTSASASASATPTALPESGQLLQESARTTETLRTLHINLAATDLPQLPVASLSGDLSSEVQGNGQAVGRAMFRATPDAQPVDTEFLVTDRTFYTKGADGKWNSIGPSDKIYDPAIVLDKDKGLAAVIKGVKNAKVEGREDVEGTPTIKVTGTVDGALIDPLVPPLGKDGGELPITLWIADVAPPETSTPPTIPSESASTGAGPNLVRFVVTKDAGNANVTFSNWAKPVTIPSPTG